MAKGEVNDQENSAWSQRIITEPNDVKYLLDQVDELEPYIMSALNSLRRSNPNDFKINCSLILESDDMNGYFIKKHREDPEDNNERIESWLRIGRVEFNRIIAPRRVAEYLVLAYEYRGAGVNGDPETNPKFQKAINVFDQFLDKTAQIYGPRDSLSLKNAASDSLYNWLDKIEEAFNSTSAQSEKVRASIFVIQDKCANPLTDTVWYYSSDSCFCAPMGSRISRFYQLWLSKKLINALGFLPDDADQVVSIVEKNPELITKEIPEQLFQFQDQISDALIRGIFDKATKPIGAVSENFEANIVKDINQRFILFLQSSTQLAS
jgi:hypothetical protein